VLLPDNVAKAKEYRDRMTDEDMARMGDSMSFARGDARSMVRYMRPGRAMVLPADELRRYKTIDGSWNGGHLRLARGAFRIANLTASVVFPVVVTDAGRWRYHVHVGGAVPQALIQSDDEQAAADHVTREIMSVAETRPAEAAGPLVSALRKAAQVAGTNSEDDAPANPG
jgi:lauroyl/myristoyl acyltransferase